MSEQPPIWDQPDYQLPPPVGPAPSRHRSTSAFPFIPVAFAVAGLVLGVLATLLVSNLGSSHKNTPVAAAPLGSAASSGHASSAPASTRPNSKAASSSAKKSSSAPVVMPAANEAGLAHAVPLSVQIPKIGVSSTLVGLGLAADGTLQTPTDYAKAGWYASGAYPGDPNEPPALIVGHVDNYKGPAVFFKLRELTAGDRVLVPRADGSTATFVVYKTADYLKTAFPAQSVYATTGRPELRLITCTGQFDTGARSYLSNFVAYAYLASAS
jgi:sortase (surface protein transpeptidase)